MQYIKKNSIALAKSSKINCDLTLEIGRTFRSLRILPNYKKLFVIFMQTFELNSKD